MFCCLFFFNFHSTFYFWLTSRRFIKLTIQSLYSISNKTQILLFFCYDLFQIFNVFRSYCAVILKLSYFFLQSIFRVFLNWLIYVFEKNTYDLLYRIFSTHYYICYKFVLRMYPPRVSNSFLHSSTYLIMLLFSYYNLRSLII